MGSTTICVYFAPPAFISFTSTRQDSFASSQLPGATMLADLKELWLPLSEGVVSPSVEGPRLLLPEVSPELLEALLDAESLSNVARGAKAAAAQEDRAGRRLKDRRWEDADAGGGNYGGDGNANDENSATRGANENIGNRGATQGLKERKASKAAVEPENGQRSGGRKGNARVLALQLQRAHSSP